MNNLLIITGAGASYDVVDYDLIPVNFNMRPPITRNLFFPDRRLVNVRGIKTFEESMYVNDCLEGHPVAAKIGLDYKVNVHQNKEKGLENYLTSIKNNKKILIKNQFWAVPIYLYSLFSKISAEYIPCKNKCPISTNYKLLLERIINSSYEQILWLNLNYDLFADYAIMASVDKTFYDLNNYMNLVTADGLRIKYTKPHGSIDWFKIFDYDGLDYAMDWNIISREPKRLPTDFEDRLSKKLLTDFEAKDMHRSGKAIIKYPAITAPIGEYEFVCASHKEEIAKELKNTSSVLCIGFSALDKDILDFIRDNIIQINKLKIVNGKSNPTGDKAYNILKECCKDKLSAAREDSVFNGGFSDFIREGIQGWLGKS